MKYENDFKNATELDDKAREELFAKIAAENSETVDDIVSQYAMWEQECEASGVGDKEDWYEKVASLDAESIDVETLMDELAALELDGYAKKRALDCLCDKLDWNRSNCVKDLTPDYNAAKKRHAERKHREKMEAKKARREADAARRKHFYNYHRRPFHDLLKEVIAFLATCNVVDPKVFVSGTGVIILHTNSKTGLKEIVECDVETMRYLLAEIADWSKLAPDVAEGDGEMDFKAKYTSCPKDVASAILCAEAVSLGLPELNGLAHAPFFDKDGNLVMEPGYHAASGCYYCPPEGAEPIPPVSPNPTAEEVAEAVNLLLEAYWDFPFNDGEEFPKGWFEADDPNVKLSVGKASRANQLAKTVQPFMHQMIPGSLPLHVVDKAAPRTGSQFMAEVVGVIATGAAPPAQAVPKSDEEWQKSLLTLATGGSPYWLFDNAKVKIDSDALASAITAGVITGRQLGHNRQLYGACRSVVEVNGNGLTFDKDLKERVMLVRLDAKMKEPGDRKVFRHPSLKTWCRENRPKLIWSCLTIIQNWIAKGKPMMKEKRRLLAGFEDYCRVMGGVLEAAGVEGFNDNRHLIRTDKSIEEMQPFVIEWLKVFGTEPARVGMCDRDANANPIRRQRFEAQSFVELLLDMSGDVTLGLFDNPNKQSLGSRLGKKLQEYCDRVFEIDGGTYQMTYSIRDGLSCYRLVPQNGTPERARAVPATARGDISDVL